MLKLNYEYLLYPWRGVLKQEEQILLTEKLSTVSSLCGGCFVLGREGRDGQIPVCSQAQIPSHQQGGVGKSCAFILAHF